MFQVVVGNVGLVYEGSDEARARFHFAHYVEVSKSGLGRAGHEPVTLLRDGEIVAEYDPDGTICEGE